MMSENFTTKSSAETVELGKKFAEQLQGGEIVFLVGDLGGGKTQFAKGVAEGLGIKETVVSPTFTIERIYQGKSLTLHHFDLYRLHDDNEISEQIHELTGSKGNIVLIEWPENMKSISDLADRFVRFEYIDENERKITLEKR